MKAKDRITKLWGYYDILDDSYDSTTVVKRLVIAPGLSISLQRHSERCEVWVVAAGFGTYISRMGNSADYSVKHLWSGDYVYIEAGEWHQVINGSREKNLEIIEIQTGQCNEDDIERFF
jgi:mannose-1-phosphate guanylyltransferase/mannose-6-phosphate isomerase